MQLPRISLQLFDDDDDDAVVADVVIVDVFDVQTRCKRGGCASALTFYFKLVLHYTYCLSCFTNI